MATFKAQIDSGWASSTLTLVALRNGASLGTASATLSTVQSVTVATATIDLSSAGAGVVDLVLRDAGGNVAWTDSQEINAAGAVVDNASLQTLKQNAQLARQLLTNKHVVTDNGDGTYDIAVRNDADDGDSFSVRGFNNVTGNRSTPSGIDVVEESFE